MERSRESLLQRIRACFNLGSERANTTEAEMATAVAMAKKLMAEHNLSEAEVMVTQPEGAAGPIVEEAVAETYSKPAPYEGYLAVAVGYLFDVHPLQVGKVIKFFGLPSDLELAVEVFRILREEINKMAKTAADENGYTPRENFHYRSGIAVTLMKRCKEQAAGLTDEQQEKCRGLVVVKDQLIKRHIAEKVGRIAPGRTRQAGTEAFAQGRQDGHQVSLNFRKSLT